MRGRARPLGLDCPRGDTGEGRGGGREDPHLGDRRRRRPHGIRRRRPHRARLRRVRGEQRRAGARARLHRAPAPDPPRRHHAGHGRAPGLPRAPVRLHQGHPRGVPHREDRARAHDGGQPVRRLRLHHQALPLRPPAAHHRRRPARRERLPGRRHRTAHAGERAGRGAADALQPRPARRHLRQPRRGPGTGATAGVRGRGRRVPRHRTGAGARQGRAHPQRGLRLHLEPRRRLPDHPLAGAPTDGHLPGRPPGDQAAARA